MGRPFAGNREIPAPNDTMIRTLLKSPFLPRVCLALAAVCAGMSFIPAETGIRIPVHCTNGRMGYIDEKGTMVLPARWKYASPFGPDGFGHVSNGQGAWTISRTGDLRRLPPQPQISMPDPRFNPKGPDERGMTLIWDYHKEDGGRYCRWILTDRSPAFPGEWDGALPFVGDFPAAALAAGAWGFINRRGETVIPHEWDETTGFNRSGLAPVARNGHWGAINPEGRLAVPLHFNMMTPFDAEGMAVVRSGQAMGAINTKGRLVIPPRYEWIEPFDAYGMAMARNGRGKTGWIDRKGETRVPFRYDYHSSSHYLADHPRFLFVAVAGKGGMIDREGNTVVPPATGTVSWIRDPLAPGRDWFVRKPPQDSHPSTPATEPFEPGCYDDSGREIWSGQGGSGLSAGLADWRYFARWLAGLWVLTALVLGLGNWRRKRRGQWRHERRNSPFLTVLRGGARK